MIPRAIIFDKDGTLFDFQATWGVWAGRVLHDLAKGDAGLIQRLAAAIDYDLDQQKILPHSIVVAGTPLEIAQVLAPILGQDPGLVLTTLNTHATDAPQVMTRGLPLALARMTAAGIRLGIMTNDAEHPARAHIESAGLTSWFDVIIGSDSGHGAKPAADPLLAIAACWGLQGHQIAMVGDSLHDLHAGRAADMQTIAVLTGLATRKDLAGHADCVLDSVSDIPDWLGLPD
ncbi:MAG: HAD family hydrolase [Pseudomonadota bacterium]